MSRVTMAAVALSVFALAPISAQQSTTAPLEALDGVDVVVLVQQGKEVFGKSEYQSTHEGIAYLFSSTETKAQFDKAPAKYAIQMGGSCARMGGTVTGNPSNYVLHEGKIYIFGSDECRKLFTETPAKYIPRPSTSLPGSAQAISRGRALLEKAAAAHGGAKLDSAATLAETSSVIQKRQTGDVTIVTKNLWKFPASVRTERTIPLAEGPQTFATVITPTDAWGGGRGLFNRPPAGMLPALRANATRALLPILKRRKDPALKIAALEPASMNGVAVDRVRVVGGFVDVTLNLDRTSGRVHSMSFYDRANAGAWGDIVIKYGDYRSVDGVLVPFTETAVSNGTPVVNLTRKLDSVAFNVPLDDALFVMPSGGAQ